MPDQASLHRSLDQLNSLYDELPEPPAKSGALEMIVIRTNDGERDVVDSVKLTGADGVVGDHWSRGSYADRPEMQVTLINSGVIDVISGGRDRWALAGDNLVVDMDLSEANLPAGVRIAIGDAILEIEEKPHTGCGKFSKRYGPDALRFVNSDRGRELRFRGVYARVVEAGEVGTGDRLVKI